MAAQNNYGAIQYWEDRFQKEDEFEWYHGWKPVLKSAMEKHGLAEPKTQKILMIGCGNSRMSQDMFDDGLEQITNIDFSERVIQKMKAKNTSRLPNMQWLDMDVKDMHIFADGDFDAVIDKGTLDCVLCAENSTKNGKLALCEIARVLKPGGKFYSISYSNDRGLHYEDEDIGWAGEMQLDELAKPFVSNVAPEGDPNYYLYVCTRA